VQQRSAISAGSWWTLRGRSSSGYREIGRRPSPGLSRAHEDAGQASRVCQRSQWAWVADGALGITWADSATLSARGGAGRSRTSQPQELLSELKRPSPVESDWRGSALFTHCLASHYRVFWTASRQLCRLWMLRGQQIPLPPSLPSDHARGGGKSTTTELRASAPSEKAALRRTLHFEETQVGRQNVRSVGGFLGPTRSGTTLSANATR